MTKALHSQQRTPKVDLSISQMKPHINLKIGKNGEAVLSTRIDTGAGLNLGNLSYHKSIYEQFPDLVASFAYIKDQDGMKEFSVGGVDENDNQNRVTAIIMYHLPYPVNEQDVMLSFGLSKSVSTNTILGITFL